MRDIQINPKKIRSLFESAYDMARILDITFGQALFMILANPLVCEALRK